MSEVILYHQPSCGSCSQVERYLHDHGVTFTAKDISADAAAMAEFLTYGYLTTPVTVIDGTPVPGFQPKRFASLLVTSGVENRRSR